MGRVGPEVSKVEGLRSQEDLGAAPQHPARPQGSPDLSGTPEGARPCSLWPSHGERRRPVRQAADGRGTGRSVIPSRSLFLAGCRVWAAGPSPRTREEMQATPSGLRLLLRATRPNRPRGFHIWCVRWLRRMTQWAGQRLALCPSSPSATAAFLL